MSTNPTFVFSYLPSPKSATNTITTTPAPTLYDQTTAFLISARKAFSNPKLTIEQDRINTLQSVKAGLEDDVDMKRKVGMGVGEVEGGRVRVVETALKELKPEGE